MAGSTATIDFQTLRIQWASHSSMFAICTHWTITKDQLIRLKTVANLPPRHDRRLRFKPKRSETRDPTPKELLERAAAIRATWDDETEMRRRGMKPEAFQVREVVVPDELRIYTERE
jgi:hypothetical protein